MFFDAIGCHRYILSMTLNGLTNYKMVLMLWYYTTFDIAEFYSATPFLILGRFYPWIFLVNPFGFFWQNNIIIVNGIY
jgi:hypothetical protein